MYFEVTVIKKMGLEINENLYTDASIEQVRQYWGLERCDREEVLEFIAGYIGEQYAHGREIGGVEGILNDENAHKIIQSHKNILVGKIAEVVKK